MKQVSNIVLASLALPAGAGFLALASWMLREPEAAPPLPPVTVAPPSESDAGSLPPLGGGDIQAAELPVASPATPTPAPAPGEPMLDPVPALDPTPASERNAGQPSPQTTGALAPSGMAEVPVVR